MSIFDVTFAIGDSAYIVANNRSNATTFMHTGEKVTIAEPYVPHSKK